MNAQKRQQKQAILSSMYMIIKNWNYQISEISHCAYGEEWWLVVADITFAYTTYYFAGWPFENHHGGFVTPKDEVLLQLLRPLFKLLSNYFHHFSHFSFNPSRSTPCFEYFSTITKECVYFWSMHLYSFKIEIITAVFVWKLYWSEFRSAQFLGYNLQHLYRKEILA